MNEPVYEMLWDCSSCATAGLLGKSQRRCPNCGAPQDPTKRYFPKPGEEVAAQGHRFQGVDWRCAACETPNGARAHFCANCGNPAEGNREVVRKADRIIDGDLVQEAGVKEALPVAVASSALAAKKRSTVPWVVGSVAIIGVAIIAALLMIKKDVVVDVAGHGWEREIDIERFEATRQSAWCDQMPRDGYSVSRHRAVRDHRDVPDGEECRDRQVDQGDGTFVVRQECRTKYRSEPVYDDKCDFIIDRWRVVRTETSTAAAMAPAPAWPAVRLSGRTSGLGAEREGTRRAKYTVHLRNAQAAHQTWACDYDEARWQAIPDGARLSMKVRLVGGAVCETLR